MLRTGELLGINADAMAHKCVDFSEFYARHLMSGSEEREAIIARVREGFTEDELVFMSIQFLHEKTMDCIKEQIKERFAKAVEETKNPVKNDTGL
jgi:hypothetical protein